MIADAVGVPVEVSRGTEFGAKGAALCAATSVGDFASVREASRTAFALQRRHEPDPRAHADFEAAHQAYRVAVTAGLGPLTALAR